MNKKLLILTFLLHILIVLFTNVDISIKILFPIIFLLGIYFFIVILFYLFRGMKYGVFYMSKIILAFIGRVELYLVYAQIELFFFLGKEHIMKKLDKLYKKDNK